LSSIGSVLVSTRMRPGTCAAIKPCGPSTTVFKAATLGKEVITMEAASATAWGDAAGVPPAATKAFMRSGDTSKPTT